MRDGLSVYVVTPGADAYAAIPVRHVIVTDPYAATLVEEVDVSNDAYAAVPVYLSDDPDAMPVWTRSGTLGEVGEGWTMDFSTTEFSGLLALLEDI